MNIEISQAIGKCRDFVTESSSGRSTREVTIIVGPIRVNESELDGGRHWDIFIGCNRHNDCEDVTCHYSRAARERRVREKEERR